VKKLNSYQDGYSFDNLVKPVVHNSIDDHDTRKKTILNDSVLQLVTKMTLFITYARLS